MKILIVPFIVHPKADAAYFLSRSMADVFTAAGMECAICCDPDNTFRQVRVYPSHLPSHPLFNWGADNRSYEEWMYSQGLLTKNAVLSDTQDIQDAIADFHPDLIIAINRPAANIAAKLDKIPCWTVVHPAMYRNAWFPSRCMHGINQALTQLQTEQELDLKTLYAHSVRRLAFGCLQSAPFPSDANITRIGSMNIEEHRKTRTNRVCIYLGSLHSRPKTIAKIIEEAFAGAPYYVYIWIKGIPAHAYKNLHYIREPDSSLINGCSAVIHDGNTYFYNQAMVNGIPQMLIADHTCMRNYNAMAAARGHFGVYLYEEDLEMAALYETYRKLMSDDLYYESAQKYREMTLHHGDLTQIHDFTYIDMIDNKAKQPQE
ncbi:MAG: hypothetical protein LKE61_08540 [Erysipelotrichaceae bacterium]|jgi:UDP:flavonoid glycosyltransferase YjiC (YdhE family)|nr:nucleotide disphospho-sugar-binding domain-containing protein [Lactimicrobium massiliense]MCH4020904.1 hypothetical protein [Erysipelotrichaceae bacterium]MCI1364082.1 hypothetical protein [Solobacterium sp.]MCH4044098.1 hypothetical protein [Erysipelotrichaceae bacterium]MCH4121313.1 hypothetical protein [Erysipelotrichaceae bacterium]MDD6457798.1 hypothetical protein [Lactimicrobium massiliense]